MAETTILIVEDEAIVAADLYNKLRQLGYEVAGIVPEGKEAVKTAVHLRPDLVLMDIRLEGDMDGIEAADEITRLYDVPIIYLTAHSDTATLDRAKITGPSGYILKPFQERDLATQIELALHKHKADRELRQQREWLQVTLNSIGDAVISTDAEGHVTFINPAAESLTGWTVYEAEGFSISRVFRVINEKTGQPLDEPVARALKERQVVPLGNHASLVTRDGRIIPIEDTAAPILDTEGRVIGAVLVFHDVTEKRHAQEEIWNNEQRLKRAQEIAHLGSWELDLIKNKLTWSDEVYRIFGLEIQEFDATYEAFLEHVHPDDRAMVDTAYTDSLRQNQDSYEIEHRVVRRNTGEIRIVHEKCEHYRDHTGKIIRSVGMVHDITEQKKAGDALRESEQRYRDLFDAMNEGFALHEIILDDEGQPCDYRFLTANPAFERQTGLKTSQIIGKTLKEVMPEAEDFWIQQFGRIVTTGESAQFEHWSKSLGRCYEVSAFRTEPGRFATVFLDITDRKKAEIELRQSRDDLEQRVRARTAELELKNQELQDFAFTASHDLQEPLRKITAFGDRLRKRYGEILGETGLDYLERMIRATTRMRSLLNSLLEYSRITTRAEPFQEVDLNHVIREVLSDLEVRIERTKGQVETGDLPAISADPTQMHQLFQNLIGNGLKFHRRDKRPVVKIKATSGKNGNLRITVEDNGIGFDEVYADRIFQPFQRLHGRSEYEGAGMGLAICKKIVERHRGTLAAESSPGKGSTFIVTLPV